MNVRIYVYAQLGQINNIQLQIRIVILNLIQTDCRQPTAYAILDPGIRQAGFGIGLFRV